MIEEIIKKWDNNKTSLENYFKEKHPESYKEIIEKIFELVINVNEKDESEEYEVGNLVVIDHGEYQGTQIFIIPKKTYQPSIGDYLVTHNHYGSCSGCDTLQSISNYSEEKPDETQVKDYMGLSLNLIQRMKILGNDDN